MRWFKKHLGNVGIASICMLFLLTCLALLPLSAASVHVGASGVAAPTTVSVQATPTVDATMTALNKEQLMQEVAQQQHTWDNWFWSNAATILSSFLSTLVIVIGALFGLWRWRRERQDGQDKELKAQAEDRFKTAVTALGDEKESVHVGGAILLRTFLRPGYEQFYTQTFDLAVANLRLPRTPKLSADPRTPLPLTTLSQALIVVFKEAFSLARDRVKKENAQFSPQFLDASCIQLDNAYLDSADLGQIWIPRASLQNANLSNAHLSGANLEYAHLFGADLSGADLSRADLFAANLSGAILGAANLSGTDLRGANLRGAMLSRADLSGANLSIARLMGGASLRADLSEANLSGANLSGADLNEANLKDILFLEDTNLRGVKGLTKEQLKACQVKGAIIDEDPTTSASQSIVAPSSPPPSNDTQALSAPPAQESILPPDPDGSSTASSQQESES